MKLDTMKILRVLIVFLLFSSFCSVMSHPSRPLNERTTELALQEAWLLIDDQNQSKQQNIPDIMRRKVVAKSVFIAPTFKLDELPPCADGYTADSMGRCVKIIQLDPDAHLQFLFQKLVGNFGGSVPDAQQEEGMPTSGPVQFTVDLDLTKSSQEESDDSLKSTDVALVFTTGNAKPIKKDNDEDGGGTKTLHDAMGNLNFSFVPAPTNGSFDPAKINVKNEEKNSGDTETTTADTISEAATEPAFSTTLNFGDETSTTYAETTTQTETATMPSETFTTETDEDHRHALFFKVPLHHQSDQNVPTVTADTSIGSRIKFEEETMNNDEPEIRDSTNLDDDDVSSKVTFKDSISDDQYAPDLADLMMSENVRHSAHRIRFPDERNHAHYSNRNPENVHHFRRPQRQNQKPILFTDHENVDLQAHHHSLIDRLQPSVDDASTTEHHMLNRRNRDKNFWRVPPTWRGSSPNRALVLRFSRRPGNSSSSSNITLGDFNRYRSRSAPLYRQVRIEDLSYIFGHGRNRR